MKTKTLIVGSVLVAVGVGAYFFLIKNKNAGAELIPNGLASVGTGATTSGAESQTEAPPPATIDEIAVNQNKIIEQQKLLTAQGIQSKYVGIANNLIATDCEKQRDRDYFGTHYSSCVRSKQSFAIVSINKEINPLGYKLSKYSMLSEIVPLVL